MVYSLDSRFYGIIEVLSLTLNLAIMYRIKRYKSNSSSSLSNELENVGVFCLSKNSFLKDLDSMSLPDLMTNFYACLSGVLFFLNQMMVNRIDPSLINEQPYLFYVYFIFFINPALMGNLSIAIFYSKHPTMRRFLMNEIMEAMLRIRDNYF